MSAPFLFPNIDTGPEIGYILSRKDVVPYGNYGWYEG